MKRELIKLIGGVPTIVSTDVRKLGRGSTFQKWVWSRFNNPARSDGLKLYHWQRIEDVNKDYEFAQYNCKIDLIDFSQDEYNTLIKPNDTNWTYEETRYLWGLLERFDLRFTVVHDRYDEQTYQERTVEELKDRYYSICRKILESRKLYDHPILKSGYNYEQEMKRRSYIERTMNRSTEETNEENNLLKQGEEIEKQLDKYDKIENSLKNISISNSELGETNLILPKQDCSTFEDYIKKNATENDSFVYLRSQKMKHNLPVSEKIQLKVEAYLKELNLPERLVPTVRVELAYDTLRNSIVLYTSLKKYLEKKEKEYILLSTKLRDLQSKKAQNNMMINSGNTIRINAGGNTGAMTSSSQMMKTEQNFDGSSVAGSSRAEKKRNKSGTPIKPRKRKTNPEEDSIESSTNTKKQRKKGQK